MLTRFAVMFFAFLGLLSGLYGNIGVPVMCAAFLLCICFYGIAETIVAALGKRELQITVTSKLEE